MLFREHIALSQALELVLEAIAGDISEEESSDIDDPVEDADYHPPQQQPSSSEEEESSGNEDPIPQPTEASRGRKLLLGETDGEPFSLFCINISNTGIVTYAKE